MTMHLLPSLLLLGGQFAQAINPVYQNALAQLQSSGLDPQVINLTEQAVSFEESNWAAGSVEQDPFYDLPANASTLPAGSLLKVEPYTNTSLYTLPPTVALSRFLFLTATVNGSVVPASAFVLWPFAPRSFPTVEGVPFVAWAHGTSGTSREAGPSHIRNLWYQFSGPFTIALDGYAVVAPDYAGLGVGNDTSGQPIVHQYMAHSAAANDLANAVKAAKVAFPRLSHEWIAIGHSEGGGAAWSVAQRQAYDPTPGYIGAMAGSPATDFTYLPQAPLEALAQLLALIAQGVPSILPSFSPSMWLTPEGLKRLGLYQALSGAQSTALALLSDPQIIRPDWAQSAQYLYDWVNITGNGGRALKGPMLVIQGDQDALVRVNLTQQVFNDTCAKNPDEALDLRIYEGASHVPVMFAGHRDWLGWIEDRFSGRQLQPGCRTSSQASLLEKNDYQKEVGYILEYPTEAYQLA